MELGQETNRETRAPFVSRFVSSKRRGAGWVASSVGQKSVDLPINRGWLDRETKIPRFSSPFVSSGNAYRGVRRKRTEKIRNPKSEGRNFFDHRWARILEPKLMTKKSPLIPEGVEQDKGLYPEPIRRHKCFVVRPSLAIL